MRLMNRLVRDEQGTAMVDRRAPDRDAAAALRSADRRRLVGRDSLEHERAARHRARSCRGGHRQLPLEARRRQPVLPARRRRRRVEPRARARGTVSSSCSPTPTPAAWTGGHDAGPTRTGRTPGARSATVTSSISRSRPEPRRRRSSTSSSTGRKTGTTSNYRILEVQVRPSSVADFQMLANADISYGATATTYGKLYAGIDSSGNAPRHQPPRHRLREHLRGRLDHRQPDDGGNASGAEVQTRRPFGPRSSSRSTSRTSSRR